MYSLHIDHVLNVLTDSAHKCAYLTLIDDNSYDNEPMLRPQANGLNNIPNIHQIGERDDQRKCKSNVQETEFHRPLCLQLILSRWEISPQESWFGFIR